MGKEGAYTPFEDLKMLTHVRTDPSPPTVGASLDLSVEERDKGIPTENERREKPHNRVSSGHFTAWRRCYSLLE